jgi:hypothetical protein
VLRINPINAIFAYSARPCSNHRAFAGATGLRVALASVGGLLASIAIAEPSLLAGSVRTLAATGSGSTFTPVPLDDSGATEVAFSTAAPNSTVKISYNAECGVVGAVGVWVSVAILVDGEPTFPNVGTDFAFCSAMVDDGYAHQSAVRNVLYKVREAGEHKVTVEAAIGGGKGIWRLDDAVLIVEE